MNGRIIHCWPIWPPGPLQPAASAWAMHCLCVNFWSSHSGERSGVAVGPTSHPSPAPSGPRKQRAFLSHLPPSAHPAHRRGSPRAPSTFTAFTSRPGLNPRKQWAFTRALIKLRMRRSKTTIPKKKQTQYENYNWCLSTRKMTLRYLNLSWCQRHDAYEIAADLSIFPDAAQTKVRGAFSHAAGRRRECGHQFWPQPKKLCPQISGFNSK